jgi:hypothetical protein
VRHVAYRHDARVVHLASSATAILLMQPSARAVWFIMSSIIPMPRSLPGVRP